MRLPKGKPSAPPTRVYPGAARCGCGKKASNEATRGRPSPHRPEVRHAAQQVLAAVAAQRKQLLGLA